MRTSFADLYTKARGSKAFLVGLCTFIISWLMLSAATGWDADHGLINLVLSSEASISLAFFAMVNDRQAAAQQRALDDMKAALQVLLTISEAQRDVLASQTKLLSDMYEHDKKVLATLEEDDERRSPD